jgi:UrcA family protein
VNVFIKSIPALALTALAALASSEARTADDDMPRDVSKKTVRFADLDLRKPQDAEALYQRIRLAARLVCNDTSYSWDGRRARNWIDCFDATVKDAVSRVNQPTLTAVYRERTKRAAS